VSLSKQNKAEFESMLKQALAIDVDAKPEWRLENLIMQERARWLLSRESELFLGAPPDSTNMGYGMWDVGSGRISYNPHPISQQTTIRIRK
jgi:hypothetical protein